VIPTLLRAGLRHLLRHPGESALSVLGIALGVAVVVSIDLANQSAWRAFGLSADAVTGRATHQVTAGPSGLDEDVYRRLRVEARGRPSAPVVEGHVGAPDFPGRTFRLLGVDPFAEGPFRSYRQRGRRTAGPAPLEVAWLLVEPGGVVISETTARDLGLAPGASLRVRVNGRVHALRVTGQIDAADARGRDALEGLLVADVATAQEVLSLVGRLTRIDLAVPEGAAGARLLARVAAALPPGAVVERAESRGVFVEQVSRAFTTNLTALSLLALVVGMFLIYNTTTFSVVRRRTEIGRLRALGVTRGEVMALLLVEAALLGLVATALGLGLGVALARGLLGLVTRTINDLYFVLAVRDVAIEPLGLAKGALLGVGATLAAAVAPALEATTAPPAVVWTRASLEARHRRGIPRAAALGALVLGGGGALLALGGRGLVVGYASLFVLVLGTALLTPAVTVGLARAAVPPARWLGGAFGALAVRGVTASLSRTGVAVAALMVAVAATVGVSVMVQSFRATVVRWLTGALVDDVYVAPPGLVGSRADATFDPAVAERLRATPGVAAAHTTRQVRVGPSGSPTHLLALGLTPGSFRQFRFLAGDPDAIWAAFQDGGAVIVSEALAYRRRLGPGAGLRLLTDRGPHDFPIAGVFVDYRSDHGVAAVSRRTYDAFWDDRGVSSLGLVVAPGTDLRALMAAVRERAGPEQELLVLDNRALLASSIELFDHAFTVTGVVRLLATAVAFVGVLSALMALQLERAREVAVLRAQGLAPAQLWGVVTAQTGLMGLSAGLVAVPVGVMVALVLVHVINRRAFGWTLEAHVGPDVLGQALVLAVGAALLAGAWPAFRMARTPPAAGLREE
jgi:putative ABC transport system permease protein